MTTMRRSAARRRDAAGELDDAARPAWTHPRGGSACGAPERAGRPQPAAGSAGSARPRRAAVALTVVAALVAVILTRPSTDSGQTAGLTRHGAQPDRRRAGHGPAEAILVTGEEPDPTILVVQTERGDFARVDLSTGSINGPLTGKGWTSMLRVGAGGAMVCLCVEESGRSAASRPTTS